MILLGLVVPVIPATVVPKFAYTIFIRPRPTIIPFCLFGYCVVAAAVMPVTALLPGVVIPIGVTDPLVIFM